MGNQEEVVGPPELEVESMEDECEGRSSVMPWLMPVLMIAAFFVFVALLVLFIL